MQYKGFLEGFPEAIVRKMLEHQVAQGNQEDVAIFDRDKEARRFEGGFDWERTQEGMVFWVEVVGRKNFDLFFETYPEPQQKFPCVMLVGGTDDFTLALPRVVIAYKKGYYISWINAKTLEEAENEIQTHPWNFAWPLSDTETVTLTEAQIKEAFGCKAFKIVKE
jgi:hypothetical protein